MAWTERTSAPTSGTEPYDWDSAQLYQCTWYAYWRVQEGGGYTPPCWYSGSGNTGTGLYTNAKDWLDHYRSPWEVKDLSYTPVAGDIIVFTGTYGHVVVVEKVNSGGTLTITDYNLIAGNDQFGRKTNYTYGDTISGPDYNTGDCIGALHYPDSTPPTPGQTETLQITITPGYGSGTMLSSQTFIDFTFGIAISGIPAGETVSGGNSFPGMYRVANTGWSYTDYVVDGQTYRTATKRQTLRYDREHPYYYTITKHMYFNITKSTGTISTDTPMYITVMKRFSPGAICGFLKNRRKRGLFSVK